MQNSHKQSVSQQELDNLLKQAFLNLDVTNPKNTDMMETVANFNLNKRVPFKGVRTSFTFLKWIIAVIIVLSALLIASYYMLPKQEEEAPVVKEMIASLPEEQGVVTKEMPVVETLIETPPNKVNKQEALIPMEKTTIVKSAASQPQEQKQSATFFTPETKTAKDTTYQFLILTEDEIKQNHKRKEKMIRQSLSYSKEKYTSVSRGSKHTSHYVPSVKIPFGESYLQTTEVSNIEYKTFLFDLLIRGDKAEFLLAKPQQSLWNIIYDASLGKYYEDNYFSDKKYNDYPVVNVSIEGAELYCKWLQNETEKAAIEKDISFLRIYRLPDEQEWGYAAQGGKGNVDFPWGGPNVRNAYGIYMTNICLQKTPEKLEPSQNSEYTAAGLALKDGKNLTASVGSFTVNNYGLYHMSGNVAEFVKDHQTGKVLLKGGSWNSSLEEARIDYAEEIKGKGASPYNGFRVFIRETEPWMIFSYQDAGDTDFVFPKPTKSEIRSHLTRKQNMIKALLTFQKDKYALVPMGSCVYQGKTVSAQAFYMQTTEVSNADYKTFVMDLWINGKKEDFLRHLPDQKQWTKKIGNGFLEAMEHMYFSHPAYDDYPVVNISRENAEAYALWLTTEANKQQQAAGKVLVNDVRLPSDIEWALAASNKKNYVRYANGTDSLKNNKGKYLQNYSCCKINDTYRDTVHDVYVFKERKEENPVFVADGGFNTTYVKAYAPDLYGIYGLAGNVSEMVYIWDIATNKAKGFGTKGGSWFSTNYFLEIDAGQEFLYPEKASPLVGFRLVVSAASVK